MPRAPLLLDEPVYQNEREGFRFLVPEVWKQHARAEVPAGPVTKERLLVQYRRLVPGQEATFEVSLADLSAGTDLAAFLGAPSFGVDKWRPTGKAVAVTVNGVSGQRFAFGGRAGKQELQREVVAFRRGERVYFFTTVFPAADTSARDQVRRAVGGLVWKQVP
jgi:hypothetical protein